MISTDWQKAFDSLFSEHLEDPETALVDKRAFVKEVADRRLLRTDLLRSYWSLYVASSTDIFLPLCLGWRKILLLDPCFKNIEKQLQVDKRIETALGVKPEADVSGSLRFPFDFGEGYEMVTVKPVCGRYPHPKFGEELVDKMGSKACISTVHNQILEVVKGEHRTPTWLPTDDLAMLMGFSPLTLRLEAAPEVMERVVSGGCIFNTTRYEGLKNSKVASLLRPADDETYGELIGEYYDQEGQYQFVPLETELAAHDYTMLIRR